MEWVQHNFTQRRRRAYLGDEHRGGHALDTKTHLRLGELGVLPDLFELACRIDEVAIPTAMAVQTALI